MTAIAVIANDEVRPAVETLAGESFAGESLAGESLAGEVRNSTSIAPMFIVQSGCPLCIGRHCGD
jgi:hypothetical protein